MPKAVVPSYGFWMKGFMVALGYLGVYPPQLPAMTAFVIEVLLMLAKLCWDW
jgi:uncharacterized membrane protein YbaN (DUF454 family)